MERYRYEDKKIFASSNIVDGIRWKANTQFDGSSA